MPRTSRPRLVRFSLLVITALLLAVGGAPRVGAAQTSPPKIGPDIPVTPTDLAYTAANNSPSLAADPTDPRFVAAAHRTDSPMFSCGLQVSGDGGRGWVGAEPVPKLPAGAEHCYAPEVVFDRAGALYYLFVGLQGAGNAPMGVFLTTSTDRGRSFSTPWKIQGSENYMVRLGVDTSMGSVGRLYLVWLHSTLAPPLGGLADSANPILAAHSDDGGHKWTAPVTVAVGGPGAGPGAGSGGPRRPVAPTLVVGPDHAVHVTYYDLGADARDYQGLEGPAWEGAWSVAVSTSVDRGASFGPPVVVDAEIAPPGRVMLIYTMPPPAAAAGPNGSVYAAWPDARAGAGGADVFYAQSGDGGRSWSPARRVNDDPPVAGHPVTHELPRLGVSPGGRVDLAFLDRRNDPDNLKADVYFTSSTDGGRSFGPNLQLTREPSDTRIGQRYAIPSAKDLVEFGSRIAVLSRPDDALVAWPDTRNASIGTNQQDIFATVVQTGPGATIAAEGPDAGATSAKVTGAAGGADDDESGAGRAVAVVLAVAAAGLLSLFGVHAVRHRRRVR